MWERVVMLSILFLTSLLYTISQQMYTSFFKKVKKVSRHNRGIEQRFEKRQICVSYGNILLQ
jgi:hypothetical protein